MDPKETKGSLFGLEDALVSVNAKLPALPKSVTEWIVKATPWIIIIISILMLPAVFAIFGLGAIFGTLSLGLGVTLGFSYYATWLLALIAFIMQLVAVKGLFARSIGAWRILFYVIIINAISALISLSIASLIISAAISLYFLFQIRSYYK